MGAITGISLALIMSFKLSKLKANILDVFLPTCLIPRPNINLSKLIFLLFSID